MVDLKKIDFDKGCEECGILEELFSTITDGKLMLLCRRCAQVNNSFIFIEKKEELKREQELIKLKQKPTENFTLNDLYERYREMKLKKIEEKHEVMHEQGFFKDLEKEHIKDIEDIKKAVNEKQEIEFDFKIENTKKFKVNEFFKVALERLKSKKKENKKINHVRN